MEFKSVKTDKYHTYTFTAAFLNIITYKKSTPLRTTAIMLPINHNLHMVFVKIKIDYQFLHKFFTKHIFANQIFAQIGKITFTYGIYYRWGIGDRLKMNYVSG